MNKLTYATSWEDKIDTLQANQRMEKCSKDSNSSVRTNVQI